MVLADDSDKNNTRLSDLVGHKNSVLICSPQINTKEMEPKHGQ